jgi:hypothetical protein
MSRISRILSGHEIARDPAQGKVALWQPCDWVAARAHARDSAQNCYVSLSAIETASSRVAKTRFCHRYDYSQTRQTGAGKYELIGEQGRFHQSGNSAS